VFPVLTTKRLVLRGPVPEDARRVFELLGDAHEMRWLGRDPIADLEEAQTLIAMLIQQQVGGEGFRWVLSHSPESELIGSCGLFRWSHQNRSAHIGYDLFPAHQGQGLMHEAISEILEYAFEIMELNRVVAEIHGDNRPSLKVARRLGFVLEGVQREAGRWRNEFHDLQLWSLLAADWRGH